MRADWGDCPLSLTQLPSHRHNGRIRGWYVYLLMFQVGEVIFVKVGQSGDPIKRLSSLLTGCPTDDGVLAVAELPSRLIAGWTESALHRAFRPWRIRGEWFEFRPDERELFNRGWKHAVADFASSSWPIRWTKLSVGHLLRQARQRQAAFAAIRAKRRPSARRDFEEAARA